MKTRNLILSLVAFAVAIGSAFATLVPTTTAYIKVKYSGQSQFTCVNTGMSCDDSPTGSACQVRVQDLNQLAKARANSNCPTPSLKDSSPGGEIGTYNDELQIIQIDNN